FFFSSRRRHTRFDCDWSSDVCSSDLLEMLLTGKPISARRGLELGLVNRVVPAAQLDAAIDEYVQAIVASSPLTIRLGKRAFYDRSEERRVGKECGFGGARGSAKKTRS